MGGGGGGPNEGEGHSEQIGQFLSTVTVYCNVTSTVVVTNSVSMAVIVSISSLLVVTISVMVEGGIVAVFKAVVTISDEIVVVTTTVGGKVVTVTLITAVIVVVAGTVVVTVIVDAAEGDGARITLQSSLPPFSRIVFEILLHNKRLPKANPNAVEALPAVSPLISAESIVERHTATRSTTPRARVSCPVTILSISGYTAS